MNKATEKEHKSKPVLPAKERKGEMHNKGNMESVSGQDEKQPDKTKNDTKEGNDKHNPKSQRSFEHDKTDKNSKEENKEHSNGSTAIPKKKTPERENAPSVKGTL